MTEDEIQKLHSRPLVTGLSIGCTVAVRAHSADAMPGELSAVDASGADVRCALGITDATWNKYNPSRRVETEAGVKAFAAGGRSLADIKKAAEFLSEIEKLSSLGAYELGKLDFLYFDFVRAPMDSAKWEDEPPGSSPGAPLDVEKAAEAFQDLFGTAPEMGSFSGHAWDAMQHLDKVIFEEHRAGRDRSSKIPHRPGMAEMWRAAAFIALAEMAGVFPGKRSELAELFWEYRSPRG